jgi:hypothetical protein
MIRPVELSDTLSKTELVGKMYQIQKASSEMEQRQAASVLKDKITGKAEKTQEPEKSDMLVISEDNLQEEKKKKDKQEKEESGDEDQEAADENPPERLDLKA